MIYPSFNIFNRSIVRVIDHPYINFRNLREEKYLKLILTNIYELMLFNIREKFHKEKRYCEIFNCRKSCRA